MKFRFLFSCLLVGLFFVPLVSCAEVPRDFLAEVGKGNIEGHELVPVRSHSHIIGVTEQIIWCLTTDYVFPTTATLMNVSSSDVDDVVDGTGAWNITVYGLDADWVEQQEVIQMNGQTPVSTTNQYIRINSLQGIDAGTTEINEGIIYIGVGATVAGVPATTYNLICADEGNSFTGLYSIPVNHTGFLVYGIFGTADNKAVEFMIQIKANIAGENRMWKNVQHFHVDQQFVPLNPNYGKLPVCADFMLRSQAAGADTKVTFNMKLLIIDNDVLNDSALLWGDGSTSEVVINDPIDIIIESSEVDLLSQIPIIWTVFISLGTITLAAPSMIKVKELRLLSYPLGVVLWLCAAYIWAIEYVDTGFFAIVWVHLIPILIQSAWGFSDLSVFSSKRNKYE